MLMVDASRVGALDADALWIDQLVAQHPDMWGAIAKADHDM